MTLAPSRQLGHGRLLPAPPGHGAVPLALGAYCCVPGCTALAEPGWHHIEPRSRTGGPVDFVIIDGLLIFNKTKLCSIHHMMVTGGIGGYGARIIWRAGSWRWCERFDFGLPVADPRAWRTVGPLNTEEVTDGAARRA